VVESYGRSLADSPAGRHVWRCCGCVLNLEPRF
jgi:hypothetical protein